MTDVIETAREVRFVRWIATVFYRTELGLIDVDHDIVELDELADLIECGPDWNTIDRVEIVRADGREDGLTVEKAAGL